MCPRKSLSGLLANHKSLIGRALGLHGPAPNSNQLPRRGPLLFDNAGRCARPHLRPRTPASCNSNASDSLTRKLEPARLLQSELGRPSGPAPGAGQEEGAAGSSTMNIARYSTGQTHSLGSLLKGRVIPMQQTMYDRDRLPNSLFGLSIPFTRRTQYSGTAPPNISLSPLRKHITAPRP